MLWLILKLSTQTPEKVYYYDFIGENDEPEAQEYRPAKPRKPKEKKKKVHRPRKSSLLSVSTPVESESILSFESKGFNWDLEENRRMSKINELSQISEIQPNEESFFKIRNRKKEPPEQKNFFTVGLKQKPSIDEKPLTLPRIKSVSQQPKNDFYPEPPNNKNQKYFGREKEEMEVLKKEKEEDFWKEPNKDKAIFKEFVEDRSFLSGDDDELVLDKETLVKILKDYKGKVKEKITQKQRKESKNNKIPDEDDVRIKEKEIILSKNQLRELLEKHEDYVKNNYNENRQRENELLMQQKLEEMSGDENNENQNSSSNKIKKKKKKKRERKTIRREGIRARKEKEKEEK